ncbi:hypothetical protein KQX54_006233 [Cotesia glomerata]|uniref:Myb/SANT-like DNA-binding domain-containing protein n=1 Tax=Cotesia glomerata TaxID=32391 RepID=A0AAV7J1F3_COTGL|nr:hypothetical protein KQX54_006233 [Cotesia glomerata]
MASSLPKLFSINLNDPESGKTYTISVTSDEIKRLETDVNFSSLKLSEAKDLEYAEFLSEHDSYTGEALDPNLTFDENPEDPEELNKSTTEDSAFKWAHEAILLLLDEYQKEQSSFSSGKISQKKLWEGISCQLHARGHNITGPQCQSKLAGIKKTYKNIKDHNNKSGNSAKHWPYLTIMDDLMGDKPFISPVATCSSTGKKKRTSSECSTESSTSSDLENLVNQKKAKITPANQLLTALQERAMKNEESKERRFKEFMPLKLKRQRMLFNTKKRL